jgi:hypothetical protein
MTSRAGDQLSERAVPMPADAEAYPYDPALAMESQVGLDRLRCFSDRRLAAALYEIYMMVERNSSEPLRLAARAIDERHLEGAEQDRLRRLSERALAGEFGSEAYDLAERVLVDQGDVRMDLRSLRDFDRALRRLRMSR